MESGIEIVGVSWGAKVSERVRCSENRTSCPLGGSVQGIL